MRSPGSTAVGASLAALSVTACVVRGLADEGGQDAGGSSDAADGGELDGGIDGGVGGIDGGGDEGAEDGGGTTGADPPGGELLWEQQLIATTDVWPEDIGVGSSGVFALGGLIGPSGEQRGSMTRLTKDGAIIWQFSSLGFFPNRLAFDDMWLYLAGPVDNVEGDVGLGAWAIVDWEAQRWFVDFTVDAGGEMVDTVDGLAVDGNGRLFVSGGSGEPGAAASLWVQRRNAADGVHLRTVEDLMEAGHLAARGQQGGVYRCGIATDTLALALEVVTDLGEQLWRQALPTNVRGCRLAGFGDDGVLIGGAIVTTGWISRRDGKGEELWGFSGLPAMSDLAVAPDGSFAVAGEVRTDPTGFEGAVAKYGPEGEPLWHFTQPADWDPIDRAGVQRIAMDDDGAVYVLTTTVYDTGERLVAYKLAP